MVLNKVAVKATLFLFVRRDYVKLKQNNFELYAARYYDNPNCVSREEFLDDLNRFKYIKRLCTKYRENGIIRERLVLNHLVVLYNLFGPHCTEMLYFRLKDENWSVITPFVNDEKTAGHSTTGNAGFYAKQLDEVLKSAPRRGQ